MRHLRKIQRSAALMAGSVISGIASGGSEPSDNNWELILTNWESLSTNWENLS